MLFACLPVFLALACCVAAANTYEGSPAQASSLHSVLHRVIGGPGGDTTITVTGNVQFKETITVQKKDTDETDHEDGETESYFFERCCNITFGQSFRYLWRDCVDEAKNGLSETVANDEKPRSLLTEFNCIIQCVSQKLGLSEKNGSIKSEQTVNYVLSDSRTVAFGISESMINRCINIAKNKGLEIMKPNKGGEVCNTSNLEVFKFVECMTELGNIYCPANYVIESKSCDINRRMMKKKLHGAY